MQDSPGLCHWALGSGLWAGTEGQGSWGAAVGQVSQGSCPSYSCQDGIWKVQGLIYRHQRGGGGRDLEGICS